MSVQNTTRSSSPQNIPNSDLVHTKQQSTSTDLIRTPSQQVSTSGAEILKAQDDVAKGSRQELTQTQVIGNPDLLRTGLNLIQDIFTLPSGPTFFKDTDQGPREFYQPRFTVGDLAVKACKLANTLGYSHGVGGFGKYKNDIDVFENGIVIASIYLAKRQEYAEKTYSDLVKKWDISERKPVRGQPINWYNFRDSSKTIEKNEARQREALEQFVKNSCDANGIPLDPAIERIFIATHEEMRSIFHLPPEMVACADRIIFVHKPAQRDPETGYLIPPTALPPHRQPQSTVVIEEVDSSRDRNYPEGIPVEEVWSSSPRQSQVYSPISEISELDTDEPVDNSQQADSSGSKSAATLAYDSPGSRVSSPILEIEENDLDEGSDTSSTSSVESFDELDGRNVSVSTSAPEPSRLEKKKEVYLPPEDFNDVYVPTSLRPTSAPEVHESSRIIESNNTHFDNPSLAEPQGQVSGIKAFFLALSNFFASLPHRIKLWWSARG